MTPLSEVIHQTIPLTAKEIADIENAFKPVHLLKGEQWIIEGTICNQVAFV